MKPPLDALLALSLLASQASAALISYKVTNLGVLPGGSSSTATALNGNGDVVGCTSTVAANPKAFIWTSANGMQAIGGSDSEAFGINSSDNVVGEVGGQAFRWDSVNGTVLLDSSNFGQANGLNDSGKVVGYRAASPTIDRTLTWSPTNTISNPFPTAATVGIAINSLGQIVGNTNNGTAGYYNDGTDSTRVSLGSFVPDAMNDSRIAAGSISSIAAFYDIDTSTSTTIGTLGIDTTSNALGINNAGTIVGISNGTGAFIYDPTNGLQNLTNELAPAYSGWSITSANAINENGQIAATGIFDGQ